MSTPVRHTGVAIPQNQGLGSGSPMTVTNVAELKLLLVEYVDENGRKKPPTLAVTVSGKVFVWPQGEQVAGGFRSFVEALGKQILERMETKSPGSMGAKVVMDDAVEILPEV